MAVPALRRWSGLMPAIVFSALATGLWGYFVWTGSISTLWPMLGVANQLLAAFALAIGTSVLINMGKARYAWCTLGPLAFMMCWSGSSEVTTVIRSSSPPGELPTSVVAYDGCPDTVSRWSLPERRRYEFPCWIWFTRSAVAASSEEFRYPAPIEPSNGT